jgi:hypothetical protein
VFAAWALAAGRSTQAVATVVMNTRGRIISWNSMRPRELRGKAGG